MINRLELLRQLATSIGDIGEFQLAKRSYIFVNSPSLVRDVLITHAEAFEKSEFQLSVMGGGDLLRRGLGNGLLTSTNQTHRQQEKIMSRAFQRTQMERYADVISASAEDMQSKWYDGKEIDITDEMMYLSTLIIGETFFSNGAFQDVKAVADAMNTINSAVGARSAERKNKRGKALNCIEWVQRYVNQLIASHGPDRQNGDDLLTILIKERKDQDDGRMRAPSPESYHLTHQQLCDEIYTILFAGAENPKNALSWSWYLLAKHPSIYARVRTEVSTALEGRTPTYRDLPDLPYTLQVYKEVLRLYPPGYAFGRRAIQPIKIGSTNIPCGANLLISPYTLHRRTDCFSNPELFDPERFSQEREKTIPRDAYIPFGLGQRACIGGQFAMIEGQMVIATLAQRVTFKLWPVDQQIEAEPRLTLRPAGKIGFRVERLN